MRFGKLDAALALTILSLVGFAYLFGHPFRDYVFNSDALYIETVLSDLIAKGGSLDDWFLTPAPYFFPDYLIGFGSRLFGSSPYFHILSFALLQLLLFVWFVCRLAKSIKARDPIGAGLISLFVVVFCVLNSFEPFVYSISSGFHFGEFLVSVLIVAMWIDVRQGLAEKWRKICYALTIALVSYLTALSDNLFLIQCLLPCMIAEVVYTILMNERKARIVKFFAIALIPAVIGSYSYKFIVAHQTTVSPIVDIEYMLSEWPRVAVMWAHPFISSLILGTMLVIWVASFIYFIFFQSKVNDRDKSYSMAWVGIYVGAVIVVTIFTLAAVKNIQVAPRYLIPPTMWPIVFVALCVSTIDITMLSRVVRVGLVVGILTVSSGQYNSLKNNDFASEFYPAEIGCINTAILNSGLRHGIAQYWDAKYLTAFSKHNFYIAQHMGNLDQFKWITSDRYFRDKYDFAIIDERAIPEYKISANRLVEINGAPSSIVRCDNHTIMFYGQDMMSTK